jgi:hypothetical protein
MVKKSRGGGGGDLYSQQTGTAPLLDFVSETGRPSQDPSIKKLVRRNARKYVSREKGLHRRVPLLQFQLAVPAWLGK